MERETGNGKMSERIGRNGQNKEQNELGKATILY